MSKAVPTPTGQPVGSGARGPSTVSPQPAAINLNYLDGLTGDVAKELREAEDSVVAARAAEASREELYS